MAQQPPRYRLEAFFEGGEAQVYFAIDKTTTQKVAVRILKHSFEDGFAAKRAVREVLFMKHCNHQNIIKLVDMFVTSINEISPDPVLAIVMERKQYSLRYFNQPDSRRSWADAYLLLRVQNIVYGILAGIEYLHLNGITHRDLSLNNVVVDDVCNATIIDFGLCRSLAANAQVTESPTTLLYQAPEAYTSNYQDKVDLWSIGCIFIELITGEPFMQPTFNVTDVREKHILSITSLYKTDNTFINMFETVVSPTRRNLLQATKPTTFREKYPFIKWPATVEGSSATRENAMDLLENLLKFNPDERPTATEALTSPFFKDIDHKTVVPETRVADLPYVHSVFEALNNIGNEVNPANNDSYIAILKKVLQDYSVEMQPICMHSAHQTCVNCHQFL